MGEAALIAESGNPSLGKFEGPNDNAQLNDRLLSQISSAFASSAYWRTTEVLPPREPDDLSGRKPHPFEAELSRKLVPLSEDKTSLPRILDYAHIGLHRLRGDAESPPKLNAAQLRALEGGRFSLASGRLNPAKPPFLETTTCQGRTIGKGTFGPEAVAALIKGNNDVLVAAGGREGLKGKPFISADPEIYRPCSWDYCDMSGIDPSSYRVTVPGAGGGVDPAVYRSRYNLVEREGPVRRERTTEMLEEGKNVNRKQLRDALGEMNAGAVPQGYRAWSACDWMSTTHDAHAPYNIERATEMNKWNATVPVTRTYHPLTPAHEGEILSQTQRQLSRHDGNWETEYSKSYKNSLDRTEVNKVYSKRSIFDVKNGVYTMHPYAHHPRDDATTGEKYTPSQIVPGQYISIARQPLHARSAP